MKKFLSILLCICMMLSILPVTARAATTVGTGTCGTNLNWTLDSDGLLTISGSGDLREGCLSTFYSRHTVNAVKSVVIENGVTSIGDHMFEGCQYLTSVSIPDSVTSIGEDAFHTCYKLTNLTIPSSVTSIGAYAFTDCQSLTSINIPSGVTTIGEWTFKDCSKLTSINIPSSVTSIGSWAFNGCYKLADVNFYGSQDQWNAISVDSNNEQLTTYADVHFIQASGTCGNNLTWMLDSDGILTISGTGAMTSYPWSDYKSSIKTVVIGQGVTNIYDIAFYNCTNLTSVTIPNSVTSIGNNAFDSCHSLTSINIPNSVTSIGLGAFFDCKSLTSITIPDGVTSIGKNMFNSCTGLTSIGIPDSVTEIGEYAFYGCSSLGSINLPDSVTSIGRAAFGYCTNLKNFVFPTQVTVVESFLFTNCTSLKTIKLHDMIVGSGNGAYECTNITYIAIPNSVKYLGNYPFYNCKNLTDIYYAGSETEWNAVDKALDNPGVTIHYNATGPSSEVIPDVYSASISTTSSSVTEGDFVSISVNVSSNGTYTDFSAAEIELAYSGNISFDQDSSSLRDSSVSVENGTIKLVDKGASKKLGNGIYTLKFTADAVGSGEVALISAAFGTAEEAESQDLVAAACSSTPVTITINPQNHSVTLSDIFAGADTVKHGESYTFQKETTTGAYYDYAVPTATMGGNAVSVTTNADGSWKVANVTGNLVITGTRSAKKYDVTIQGEAAEQATYGTDYSFTLPENVEAGLNKGYTYALEAVTIGGTAYTGYTTEDSKTYTIPGTDIIGDIVITYTITELEPNKFTINVSGEVGVAVGTFPVTVDKGSSFSLTLNPEAGYEYTVTAEGYDVTANGNEYTISNITGNVIFMISRSVSIAEVITTEYVTLNGTMMWLVKNETAKLDGKVYTYGGQAMYWSDRENAYCILVVAKEKPTPTAADFTIAAGTTETLAYGNDVNMTGTVDANDAQLVYNIYMSGYAGFTENVTMKKFLLADVNSDGKVTVEDAAAIVADLLK